MDTLPQFESPLYAELREWWVKYHGNPDVRRLILEVQTQRYAFAEMRMMAESAVNEVKEEAPEVIHKGRALPRLHRRLEEELRRCGRIYPEYKLSKSEAERIRIPVSAYRENR